LRGLLTAYKHKVREKRKAFLAGEGKKAILPARSVGSRKERKDHHD